MIRIYVQDTIIINFAWFIIKFLYDSLLIIQLQNQALGIAVGAVVVTYIIYSFFMSSESKSAPIALDPTKKIPFKMIEKEVRYTLWNEITRWELLFFHTDIVSWNLCIEYCSYQICYYPILIVIHNIG